MWKARIAAEVNGATVRNRTGKGDGAGRTLVSEDAKSEYTTFSFDANGNRIAWRDANDVGADMTYDARDRKVTAADTQEQSEGVQRSWAYDLNSNVVSTLDAKSKVTTFVFDARDRKVSTTDRINGTTTFAYDSNSNLLTITDAEGNVTDYTYDPRNLKTATQYPDHTAGSNPGDPPPTDYGIVGHRNGDGPRFW